MEMLIGGRMVRAGTRGSRRTAGRDENVKCGAAFWRSSYIERRCSEGG